MNTVEHIEQHIKNGGFSRLKNCVENIILRPNDHKRLVGEEHYYNLVTAVEKILNEEYKNTNIYKYYYELPKIEHGFCSLERWERGLLY